MGKQGRPEAGIEEYREWERRLQRYEVAETSLELFCLQEGVSRSTFYRWKRRLEEGIPESLESQSGVSKEKDSNESLFLPVSLTSSRVEIELPNGGVVRLPSDLGRDILVAVIRVAGSLRPWKAPEA
jgi:transposase-like protein